MWNANAVLPGAPSCLTRLVHQCRSRSNLPNEVWVFLWRIWCLCYMISNEPPGSDWPYVNVIQGYHTPLGLKRGSSLLCLRNSFPEESADVVGRDLVDTSLPEGLGKTHMVEELFFRHLVNRWAGLSPSLWRQIEQSLEIVMKAYRFQPSVTSFVKMASGSTAYQFSKPSPQPRLLDRPSCATRPQFPKVRASPSPALYCTSPHCFPYPLQQEQQVCTLIHWPRFLARSRLPQGLHHSHPLQIRSWAGDPVPYWIRWLRSPCAATQQSL